MSRSAFGRVSRVESGRVGSGRVAKTIVKYRTLFRLVPTQMSRIQTQVHATANTHVADSSRLISNAHFKIIIWTQTVLQFANLYRYPTDPVCRIVSSKLSDTTENNKLQTRTSITVIHMLRPNTVDATAINIAFCWASGHWMISLAVPARQIALNHAISWEVVCCYSRHRFRTKGGK